jgi:hypothetical protein
MFPNAEKPPVGAKAMATWFDIMESMIIGSDDLGDDKTDDLMLKSEKLRHSKRLHSKVSDVRLNCCEGCTWLIGEAV